MLRSFTLLPFIAPVLTGVLIAGLSSFIPASQAQAQVQAQVQSQATEPSRGVPYVTLRNRTGDPDPGKFYGDVRSAPEAGHCDISDIQLTILNRVAEAVPFRVPEEILRVEAVRPLPMEEMLDTLEQTADGSAPLLYVHGFYIDFEKGCRRATVLQEAASLEGRFLWFSWPSQGSLLNYTHDQADLYWSVIDIADTIIALDQRFGPGNVNLAGHSLGGRGMVMAIHDIAAQHPDIRLGHVALLAADMDFELFARILPRILPVVESLTVYVAEGDRPLGLSEQLHGHPRLGQAGNDTGQIPGVEVIDLSDLPVRSPTGHLYHVYNAQVGADLDQLMNQNMRAEARQNMIQAGPNLWRLQPEP